MSHLKILTTQFIRLHIDGRAVRCNVDLRHNVKEKRFLDARVGDEDIEEIFKRRELRDELLDDFWECFEDAVVVDWRQMKAQVDVKARIEDVITCSLMDVALRFHFEVVRHSIYFMNEHLELDSRVHFVRLRDSLIELC